MYFGESINNENYVSDGERTYLEVPYKDMSVVRLLGSRYDGGEKRYIPEEVNSKLLSK